MQIKFIDLSAENALIISAFKNRLDLIISQNDFVGGFDVSAFENEFGAFLTLEDRSSLFDDNLDALQESLNNPEKALFCDLRSVILGGAFESKLKDSEVKANVLGVANGTDALEIALQSLNLPKQSEIIICATTFKATAEAVLNAGFKAVIVDCDDLYNLSGDILSDYISSKTSAIIVTHLYGRIGKMQQILSLCKTHNLALIEDASQAHGAQFRLENKLLSAGLIGDIGTFSFYPSKNLGAIGDGGAIVSKNDRLIDRCRSIANHGARSDDKKVANLIGRNSRLDSIQAAFLRLKLRVLDENNAKRRAQALLYSELLSDNKNLSLPKLPDLKSRHVWHIYAINLQRDLEGAREELREFLSFWGVQTHVHYPKSLAHVPEFKTNVNCIIHPTPVANYWEKNVLSLPIGAHMDEAKIRYICEKINNFIRANAD
ncbi:MAG: DegT/DnrJ/EryC1/StrS family aminotransferase [Helicobacter sp.]|nr:DegT/DnrJ/EryC1/StrS family aminotransferase [Helicobacter sp.]